MANYKKDGYELTKWQRQVALLSMLSQRSAGVTYDDICRSISSYRTLTRDTFERDIKELQKFGLPITSQTGDHNVNLYFYNPSSGFSLEIEEKDIFILSYAMKMLTHTKHTRELADGIITKLLAANHITKNKKFLEPSDIDKEISLLIDMSFIMEKNSFFSFLYKSSTAVESAQYICTQAHFFIQRSHIYMHALALKKGDERWKERNFRLSRIVQGISDTFTAEPEQDISSIDNQSEEIVHVHEVVYFAIRPQCAFPLRSIGTFIDCVPNEDISNSYCDSWDVYRVNNLDDHFLCRIIATYGKDICLIGPTKVFDIYAERTKILERLRHDAC
ncbi:MAG: hypothetical protein J6M18_02330 [Actinomycetaceae bacterium]|nr:hypothetical protein [Actinomycetaceae bacterium]